MASAARLACCLAVLVCVSNIASARIVFGGPGKPRQPPHARPPHPPHPHGALGAPCELPDGGFGVCSRIQECPSLMEHLRSGNVALLKQLVCGKSRGQTLLCCASKAPPTPPTIPPTTPPPPTPELPTADLSDPEACGITRLYVPPKVVGGEPVQSVGTFPWVAALRYSQGKTFQCGAAVIARRWLLTAGHCVNIPGGPISVRVGDVNLYSPTDDDVEHPPQDIEIEQAIRHPQYKRTFSGITNDIALVQLKGDIEFSDVAKPICLPKKKSEVHPSGKVVIAGWGLTEAGGMIGTNVMQYADLNITNIATCQQSYHRSRVQRINPEQHLCARGAVTARLNPGCMPGDTSLNCQGAPDACMGDSGGPLMSFEKLAEGAVRLTSVGVVSFAIGCGSALHPGVYARVDAYVDWIQDTLAAHGGR